MSRHREPASSRSYQSSSRPQSSNNQPSSHRSAAQLPVSLRPLKAFTATLARPCPFHINVINQTTNSPSLIDDIPQIAETKLRAETIDFMHHLCLELKIQSTSQSSSQSGNQTFNQSVFATASQYWHVFFTHFSLGRFDRFELAATAVLLGAKVEERRVRVDHIIRAYLMIRTNQSNNQSNSQSAQPKSSNPPAKSTTNNAIKQESNSQSTNAPNNASTSSPNRDLVNQSKSSTTTKPTSQSKPWSFPIPSESSTVWTSLRDRIYIHELALLDAIEFNFDMQHSHLYVRPLLKEILEYAGWAPSIITRELSSPRSLASMACSFIVDASKSSIIMMYPPMVIACGAIGFTFLWKKIPQPTRKPEINQSINQSANSVKIESNGTTDQSNNQPINQSPPRKWFDELYQIDQSIIDEISATIFDCLSATYTPDRMSAQTLVNPPVSQSINQSVNPSQQIAGSTQFAMKHDFSDITADNQPTEIQSNHQPANQSISQSTYQSTSQSINQPDKKPAPLPQYVQLPMVRIELKPPVTQSFTQPVNQSAAQIANPSSMQPSTQLTNQSVNQSTSVKPSKKFAWEPKTKKKSKTAVDQSINQSEPKRPVTPPSPFLTKREPSQSISQSVNQSTNQPTKQSTNPSNSQSPLSRPPSPFLEANNPRWDQSINQSVGQTLHRSINQSLDQSINQPVDQSASQPTDQSANQRKRPRSETELTRANSIDEAFNRSIDQSINQSKESSVDNESSSKRVKVEESINQSTDQLIDQTLSPPVSQPVEAAAMVVDPDQSFNQSINQPTDQLIDQSDSSPAPVVPFDPDQSVNQSIIPVGNQSIESDDDVHGFNDDNDGDDFDQSLDLVDQSIIQSVDDQSGSQFDDESINQSNDDQQSTNQPDIEPAVSVTEGQ